MSPVELAQKLTQYEDVDTAIAVYKEANFIIGQLEDVKKAALSLAENELGLSGEVKRETIAGSCGWTAPKTKQLNKGKWQAAIAESGDLNSIQINFNVAEKLLKKAQEEYMELPEGKFFIR